MTVPRNNQRWRRLVFGVLPLTGLVAAPLDARPAGAQPRSRSEPAPVTLTWSTVSPPATPPPLAFASAVYDNDTKTVVLFGGLKADGTLSNDTWVWDGSTWTDYPGSKVQAPPAREMASMAFDPKLHQLILFGGEGADHRVRSDTWAWNGASWYDETGPSSGPSPSARADAAMAYDGADNLVLFGGLGGASATDPSGTAGSSGSIGPAPATSPTSPTFPTLPTSTIASSVPSTTRPGASTTPSPPPATVATTATAAMAASSTREQATGVAPSRRAPSPPAVPAASSITAASLTIPTAGAVSSTPMLGDTWLWTANGWTTVTGPEPTARTGAALAYDPAAGVAVLFGGTSASVHPGSSKPIADTWVWDGQEWRRLALPTAPPPRTGAAMAADASIGGLVMFGGSGAAGDLSDTWLWNGRSWGPAHTTGILSPRVGAAAAFDAATGKVLVFGGTGPGGVVLDDTVILSENAPVTLSGGPPSTPPPSSSSTPPPGSTTRPAGNAGKTGLEPPPSGSGPSGHSGLSPGRPSLSPLQALHRGDLVILRGAGFAAGSAVTISFRSRPVDVGKAVANRLGVFTATVAVPNSASDGVHRFEASGRGLTGPVSELIATVKIVGVPGSDQTSSTQQRLVLTAVALLIPGLTWMTLVVTGRVRRRRAVLP
jgi:hypothetical protein